MVWVGLIPFGCQKKQQQKNKYISGLMIFYKILQGSVASDLPSVIDTVTRGNNRR